MHSRPLLIAALPVMIIGLGGCGAPTTTAGMEARQNAHERINAFNAEFTYQQAEQDFEVGQFDRAMGSIEAAIAQVPDSGEFELLRGRIHLETHELQKALQSFLSASEKDPELADAHYYAGIVFQRWSDDEEAFNHYHAAFELEDDNVHYLLATAESLIALGELEEARQFVESRLSHFEHSATLRQLLGQIALLEGDPARSASLYGESILLDPDNHTLLEELALAQYEARDYADCNETLQKIEARSTEPRLDLMHLRARCLTHMERTVEAHGIYRELSKRRSSDVSVWTEFGTLSWQLGDYRSVAQASVQLISLAPEGFEGYMLKGLHERHRGRHDNAVKLLQQSAERATTTALPHLLLGRTLEEAGDRRGALAAYERAMEIDPDSEEARSLYATLRRRIAVVE